MLRASGKGRRLRYERTDETSGDCMNQRNLARAFVVVLLVSCSRDTGVENPRSGPVHAGVLASAGVLELMLESAEAVPRGFPSKLRLVVENVSDEPVDFTLPGPFCAAATKGDLSVRYPLLGILFKDNEGRESDSNFGPIFADLEANTPPEPEAVFLRPGERWSREYSSASFSFFGPCGPADKLSDLFPPGEGELAISLFVSAAENQRSVTNALPVRCTFPAWLFFHYTDEYQAEWLNLLDLQDEEARSAETSDRPEDLGSIMREFAAPDFSRHVSAAQTLGNMGPAAKDAIPDLIKMLQSARMYGDRVLAAHVLGRIGPPAAAALPALKQALDDPNDHVRQSATEAIASLEGHAPAAGGEPNFQGKPVSYWIERLAQQTSGAGDTNRGVSPYTALERLGSRAVPYLIKALQSDDENMRFVVGLWLEPGEAQEQETAFSLAEADIQALVETLRDSRGDVRRSAAAALGRPEAGGAVPALASLLERDPDKDVRIAAAKSLGQIGPDAKPTVPALEAALKDPLASVRFAAFEALQALGESVAPLPDPFGDLSPSGVKVDTYESFQRLPWDGDVVIFVIARGGSNVEEFPSMTALVSRMIESLPRDAQFGVVFSDRDFVEYPRDGRLARAMGEDKSAGLDFVRLAELGSGSCPRAGLTAALRFIEGAAGRKSLLVYIGNGLSTCWGTDPTIDGVETFEVITEANRSRARIHCLGTGRFDHRWLRALAEKNGGTYTRLAPSGDR